MAAKSQASSQVASLDSLQLLHYETLELEGEIKSQFIQIVKHNNHTYTISVKADNNKVQVDCQGTTSGFFSSKLSDKKTVVRLAKIYVVTAPSMPIDLFCKTFELEDVEGKAEILNALELSRCTQLILSDKTSEDLKTKLFNQILLRDRVGGSSKSTALQVSDVSKLMDLKLWNYQPKYLRLRFYSRLSNEEMVEVFKSASAKQKAEIINLLVHGTKYIAKYAEEASREVDDLIDDDVDGGFVHVKDGFVSVNAEIADTVDQVLPNERLIHQLFSLSKDIPKLWDHVFDEFSENELQNVLILVLEQGLDKLPNIQKSLLASSLKVLVTITQVAMTDEIQKFESILKLAILMNEEQKLLAELEKSDEKLVMAYLNFILSKHSSDAEPHPKIKILVNGILNSQKLKVILQKGLPKISFALRDTFLVYLDDAQLLELLAESVKSQQSVTICTHWVVKRLSQNKSSRPSFQGMLKITTEEVQKHWYDLHGRGDLVTYFLYCCPVDVSKKVIKEMAHHINHKTKSQDNPYYIGQSSNIKMPKSSQVDKLIPYLSDKVWIRMLSHPEFLFGLNQGFHFPRPLLSHLTSVEALDLLESQNCQNGCREILDSLLDSQVQGVMFLLMNKKPEEFQKLSESLKMEILFHSKNISDVFQDLVLPLDTDVERRSQFVDDLKSLFRKMIEMEPSRFYPLMSSCRTQLEIAVEVLAGLSEEQLIETWLHLSSLHSVSDTIPLRDKLCHEKIFVKSLLVNKQKGVEVLYIILHSHYCDKLRVMANTFTDVEVSELQAEFEAKYDTQSADFNRLFSKGTVASLSTVF